MMSLAVTSAGARAREIRYLSRILRMPHGDVPPGVEHAVLGQNAAGGNEVVDQRGIDRAGGSDRSVRHGVIRSVSDRFESRCYPISMDRAKSGIIRRVACAWP